ncbi:DoxX family protein [Sulfidibacter corallicola]|uniref:DoxX family protein n=1 Tax=Sulfidibacter corallicola TaxID=2818388 RepID=A0A8A4THK6_SULCO|nr:DoxX family protein [Sulfidibacter corallicola]QTD49030.1 DoxX family protein [Sulfidibacter corallicola]
MYDLLTKPFEKLRAYEGYGPLFLRLIVGFHLIYGTQDNVFSYARMLEFREFLVHHGFPFPLFSAFLSVYAQFLAGICFLLGLCVRLAGSIMIVNFLVAIAMVHIGDAYPAVFPALMMLFSAVFFTLSGAGNCSLDRAMELRKMAIVSSKPLN